MLTVMFGAVGFAWAIPVMFRTTTVRFPRATTLLKPTLVQDVSIVAVVFAIGSVLFTAVQRIAVELLSTTVSMKYKKKKKSLCVREWVRVWGVLT